MSVSEIFETQRRRLLSLAYRLTGNYADAEDAVQDTYVKWIKTDRTRIVRPEAWLTTVCTRQCLDLMKSAQRSKTDYCGVWLPEPVFSNQHETIDEEIDLAKSLSIAFLLVLERLTPKERAAFLLHEIFDMPYADVKSVLGVSEDACRKLVSRAKSNLSNEYRSKAPPMEIQEKFLEAFLSAIRTGAVEPIKDLLSEEIRLQADGGGIVPAIEAPLFGRGDVSIFIARKLRQFWKHCDAMAVVLNGEKGVLVTRDQHVVAAASFGYDYAGCVSDVFIMRNPKKLKHVMSRLDSPMTVSLVD